MNDSGKVTCNIGATLFGHCRGDGPQFRLGRAAVGLDEALREHVLRTGRWQIPSLQLGLQIAHCNEEVYFEYIIRRKGHVNYPWPPP